MTNTTYLNNSKEGYLPTAIQFGFIGVLIIMPASFLDFGQ